MSFQSYLPFRYLRVPSHPEDPVHRFPVSCLDKPHVVWLLAGLLGLNSKGSRRPSPRGRRAPARFPRGPLGLRVASAGQGRGGKPRPLTRPAGGVKRVIPRGPPAPEPPSRAPGPTSARRAGAGAGRSGPAPAHLGGAAAAGGPRPAHLGPARPTHRRARPRRPHPARGATASAAARPGRGAQETPRRCCCRRRRIPGECRRRSSSLPSASSRLSAPPPAPGSATAPRPPPRRTALAKVRLRAPPGPLLHRPSPAGRAARASPLARRGPAPRLPARPPASKRGSRARAGAGAPDREPRAAGARGRGTRRGALPAPPARQRFTSVSMDARPGRPGPAVPRARPWSRSPAPDGAAAESGGPGSSRPLDASGPGWPRSRRRARTLAGTQTHTHPTHTRSRSPSAES